ncbi:hypothetical protein ACWDNT_33370, partial [Streptomyces sp. NPDC000963]
MATEFPAPDHGETMSPENPLKAAVEKLTEPFRESGPAEGVPGAPSPEPVPVEEPTEPRGPLPPKPDQTGPETVSPTGQPTVPLAHSSRLAPDSSATPSPLIIFFSSHRM